MVKTIYNFPKNLKISTKGRLKRCFVLLLLSAPALAQEGSQGNTTIFGGAQMTFFSNHDFVAGGNGAQPGVILTERATGNFGVLNFSGDNLASTGASDAGYVDGYVRKYGSGQFVFPVGDNGALGQFAATGDGTMGAYFHVDANSAATSNLFTGGDYTPLPGGGPFATASMGAGVNAVSTVEYWDIDGTTPTPITLTWDAGSAISDLTGAQLSKLTIVGWDGSRWVAIPSAIDPTSVLGGASDLNAGSITTSAAVTPNTYTAYTFASREIAPLSTIVISKKAQSEVSPGVDFGFTSNIPSGSAFTLNDDAAFIAMQDVGMGSNNTIWAIAAPPTAPDNGLVYYRPAGTTDWIAAPGAGTRIDVYPDGTPILINAQGHMFTWTGSSFLTTTAVTINAVDIGVSAGTVQSAYVLLANAGTDCSTLFRWDGGSAYTPFNNVCGTRLDVGPDGSVYVLDETTGVVKKVSVSGATATITDTYPAPGYRDITVAGDGSVWATDIAQCYRLSGTTWVLDPNSGGVEAGTNFAGITVGEDGDTPILTYNAKFNAPNSMRGRLIQRREDGGWMNDHAARATGHGNSIIFSVAPGTYTISENATPADWDLIKINSAGGSASTDIPTRTATVTVTAGQTAHLEFVNYNIQDSTISNSCGSPFIETFGASGSEAFSVTSSTYLPYHYNELGAETYRVVNNFEGLYGGAAAPDHTSGDVGGYFLHVDGGFGQDEVFRRRFSGLLPGASYTLSLWATNLTTAPGYVVPNLVLEARTTGGVLVAEKPTGDIPYTFQSDWRQYAMTFTADASGTVDFIIRNNQQTPGIYGNDFAIDDITIGVGCDYGDAPDSYSTLAASNGASHRVTSFLTLGNNIDTEDNGTPGSLAMDDDSTGIDDEDGIAAFPEIQGGSTTAITNYSVNVTAANTTGATANLCGWIDWNNNGTFEAGEGVCTTLAPGATSATLTWPSATLGGNTGSTGVYARFRLTTDPLTTGSVNGGAADGEVEDYFIEFEAPLPVTLVSFDAKKSEHNVLLSWTTTAETNSDRFEIQRSTNGRSWTAIGSLAAPGESQGKKEYTFTDELPSEGENIYRLKMLDRDGTFAYSSLRSVSFNFGLVTVYPNPAHSKVTLRVSGEIRKLAVYNANGTSVLNADGPAGKTLDVSNLAAGIYTLSVQMRDGTVKTGKIAVTK